jgi:DNA modification methylase
MSKLARTLAPAANRSRASAKRRADAPSSASAQIQKQTFKEQKNQRNTATVIEMPYWRTTPSRGRKKPVGKFGVDVGQRGIYDRRNSLNELTGKEWTYFLNSIWIKAYPPVADQCGFDLRKIHPCPKPPFLMRDIVYFFTKRNEWILDPFAGVGGTLLGASLCDPPRNCVGIELNKSYVESYRKVRVAQALKPQKMLIGDSAQLLRAPIMKHQEFDLILTDPPYSDLMSRPKNGHKNKLYGRGDATPFSNSARDLGNMEYADFLDSLTDILRQAVDRLKNKKYLVVFCRDLQPTTLRPNLLHADVTNALLRIEGLQYRGMRIWHDQAADLYPFGYPYAFVMNQMHQYILIFRKDIGKTKPHSRG